MPILLVKVSPNNANQSSAKWSPGEIIAAVADDHVFGSSDSVSGGSFYHVVVTDKTLEQAEAFVETWGHEPTITQVSASGNNRRIKVTSSRVSTSGRHKFIRAGVKALLVDIEGTYVSHNRNSFQFDIVASLDERDTIIDTITRAVKGMRYKRSRWYINTAGMSYLAANGGTASGTAAQIANYLKDGLLI